MSGDDDFEFQNEVSGLDSPAAHVALITPSDSVDLEKPLRGIAFSAVGTLKIKTIAGEVVTIPSGVLAAGIIHPIRIKRVYDDGTTVTDIVGVW